MTTIERHREIEFSSSITRGVYLNHAGISPLPARSVQAVTEAVVHLSTAPLEFFAAQFWPMFTETRQQLARLMGVPPEHLAFTRNTGHALSIVADGLMLEAGDNIVTLDLDYPAVVFPWKAQEWRGIETRMVPLREDGTFSLSDLEAAMDSRTRVLTLSWIQFGTGYRTDLAACAQLAHAHGALFVADVIQGLGAFPLDSEALGIDIVATGSHKWLMSTSGLGGLYIAPHALDAMHLGNIGAGSVVDVMKFDSRDFTPKPTAQRYEEGSPNVVGLCALNASLSLLEEVGIEQMGARVLSLTAFAAERLEQRGYRVLSPQKENERSGILMFGHESHSNETISAALTDAHVSVAVRGGKVRFSPHFYNTEEEIARAVDALPE